MNSAGSSSRSFQVLTINSGSSSLKFALISGGLNPRTHLSGAIERVGQPQSRLCARLNDRTIEEPVDAPDHGQAVSHLRRLLEHSIGMSAVSAIGHRIVHGGSKYVESCLIDDSVVVGLRDLIPLAPSHLPGEIAAIDALRSLNLGIPQVACFDTSFHRDLPPVARRLPLPRNYDSLGLQRYGFHGLSYRYLMSEFESQAGHAAAHRRVILAHLGAGCSMAAVRDGQCVETTMGFTPTAGLMMATRTGDLDPGVLIHLLRQERLSADDLETLVTKRSGLVGVSETSSDVRDLLAQESRDSRAAEALDIFCYHARGWIGRLTSALEGLNTLVFSAGIGENSPVIRSRICRGLEWLGIRLDESRNLAGSSLISAADSRVDVRVMKTNEELMIFQEVAHLVTH
jgi:acetate kinase